MRLPAWHPFAGLRARHYGVILADPPWHFKTYTAEVGNRDPRNHYRTMNFAALRALPVTDLAAPDCHLFLWTTGPMLQEAFTLMEAWRFRYSGIAFTWVKLKRSCRRLTAESDFHVGLGYTTRKHTELCLLARRGNPRRRHKDVRELIVAPRREHSRKPDEAYRRIERYAAGPYCELFARILRRGWASWGKEVRKFNALREVA